MTVFTFSIALILVTSIVHVVIALQKDHIKRTGGDSIVDVIGAVALAGTTPIAPPRQTILTSLLFLNCVLLSCYLPRFFKYKENSALLQESTVFSLGVTVVSALCLPFLFKGLKKHSSTALQGSGGIIFEQISLYFSLLLAYSRSCQEFLCN